MSTTRTPFRCRWCTKPMRFASGDALIEHAEAKHPGPVSALRRTLDAQTRPVPNDL